MPIYSKTICLFIEEIKKTIKIILQDEVKLTVRGNRFDNASKTASYPITVVLYNDRKELGYFDPNFYELGFHERILFAPKEQLHSIIRHELAHYLTFIQYPYASAHGEEFRSICLGLGWGENVFRASLCLDATSDAITTEDSPILRKIQKLFALSDSSNVHEAETAMLKAQELLLKHNLQATFFSSEEKVVVKRTVCSKKRSAKLSSVARIVQTFFVNVVFSSTKEFTYLEISGSSSHVDIAEYVAHFLYTKLDELWDKTRAIYPHLKGTVAKNSFFFGIAKGYCTKVESLKKDLSPDSTQALVKIEHSLQEMKDLVYPSLSSIKSYRKNCEASSHIGEKLGRDLQIHPPLQPTESTKQLWIS